MCVFSHIRRLRIGEDSLKGDDIDGILYFVLLFTSSIHSRPLVPRQTWRLTGFNFRETCTGRKVRNPRIALTVRRLAESLCPPVSPILDRRHTRTGSQGWSGHVTKEHTRRRTVQATAWWGGGGEPCCRCFQMGFGAQMIDDLTSADLEPPVMMFGPL